MICRVQSCQNYDKNSDFNGDCILELLDFIKLHYFHLQSELKEKSSSIMNLESQNLTLNKTIDTLRQQVSMNISTPTKRRKINSSEPADSTILSTSKLFPKAVFNVDNTNTIEDLNTALSSNAMLDDSCDGFFSPQIQQNLKTPKKENKTPPERRQPLSPINNENRLSACKSKTKLNKARNLTPIKYTPTKISHYLPKRILTKETTSGKLIVSDNENKLPETEKGTLKQTVTTSGWISTDKSKRTNLRAAVSSLNNGMGFMQPVHFNNRNENLDNSSESIASSQTLIPKQSNRKERNTTNSRTNPKMKQAKLEFDRKKINIPESTLIVDDKKLDDTTCDEIVGASPGIELSGLSIDKKSLTQKSLRKINRKNSDDELFNISIKKSAKALSALERLEAESAGAVSTPIMDDDEISRIKEEPLTIKKSCVTNLFPRENVMDMNKPWITDDSIDLSLDFEETKSQDPQPKSNDKLEKNKNSNSSSVFILPSQPDDVIIVDETEQDYDFDNIDSVDLFKEIMRKGSQTQVGLKALEEKQWFKKPLTKPIVQVQDCSKNPKQLKKEVNKENVIDSEKYLDTDLTLMNTIDNKKLQELENKKLNVNPVIPNQPITLKSVGHNCDCSNCNSYLRLLVLQNLSRNEIKDRLKTNSKHSERPLKLHLTPEGFWDPIMRDFPDGDSRNEVLIDTRFIKNKS